MPTKRLLIVSLLLAAQLGVLKALPATSSQIVFTQAPDVPLLAGKVTLPPLHWDLMRYATAPELDAYRRFFADSCRGNNGKAAAVCIADVLATRFPEDNPRHEWVDAHYDPAAVLQAHLQGEPGHCVTRSGLAATALLSAGIPSRVVQMQSQRGTGHYAFEVLDGDTWHLIDPTGGSTHVSAYSLLQKTNGDPGARLRVPAGASSTQFDAFYSGELLNGMVLYPEPWLYTRIGERHASWPYRGMFLVAGKPVSWMIGKLAVQWVLLPLSVLLWASLLLLALVRATKGKA